jgi:hypothetical protein
MKPKATLANLVNSIADMAIQDSDDEETDDEILAPTYSYMVKTRVSIDPPSDVIDVKAHFEYGESANIKDTNYAISDGGADSCILGKMAKVVDYTGRHANLIGYNPKNTKTYQVPIVTAIIKAKSNVQNIIVLLKVYEAPFLKESPITLLSEYQIREYGLVIDSVAKKH